MGVILPVQDVTIGVDPHIEIGSQDCVKSACLLVPEESVRHPDLFCVGEGQVTNLV